MSATTTILLMAWALLCAISATVLAPVAALRCSAAPSMAERPLAALAWSMAIVGLGVPLTASVRGFNWATALLIVAAIPAALWIRCHGRESWTALKTSVKRVVLAVSRADAWPHKGRVPRTLARGCFAAIVVLTLAGVGFTGGDLRAPTGIDVDTLWRARMLMKGTTAWDPLASVVALLSRLSTAEAVLTLLVLRVGLIVGSVFAAARLLRVAGVRQGAATLPVIVLVTAPRLPTSWWLAVLMTVSAATFAYCLRDGDRRQFWNALAAAIVAVLAVLPAMPAPRALWLGGASRYAVEPAAAPRQALTLGREYRAARAIIVAPPLQRIELQGSVTYTDLQAFVGRYEDKVEDARFRFDTDGRPLLVFVEMRPLAVSPPSVAYRFLATQPPVYSASRERWRLAQRARALCDGYRRTHTGTTIAYDDGDLRIYKIDA